MNNGPDKEINRLLDVTKKINKNLKMNLHQNTYQDWLVEPLVIEVESLRKKNIEIDYSKIEKLLFDGIKTVKPDENPYWSQIKSSSV
jgi:hypothetical protein